MLGGGDCAVIVRGARFLCFVRSEEWWRWAMTFVGGENDAMLEKVKTSLYKKAE